MSCLLINVRFIALGFGGVRIGLNRREVLDWPPSQGRIFEALLSSALVGIPRSDADQEQVWDAFRWFEQLPAPVILASGHDENLRTAPRLAIPQNNPNKSKLNEHSILLAPTRKAVSLTDAPLEVVYQWELETEAPPAHIEILRDAAARVSYIGRGEDRAEVSLSLVDEVPVLPLVRWMPEPDGDTELWVAAPGTTDGLRQRHEEIAPPRETRRPAQRWMRLVRYSDDAPRATQPVCTALFQILPDTDDPDVRPLDCDPQNGGLWRELFRHLICDLAKNGSYWDDPAFASELLTGHGATRSSEGSPHLAIVPLPSLNANHTADGRIRRVALLGFAPAHRHAEAREVFETVFNTLDNWVGQIKGNASVRLVCRDAATDSIWRLFTGRGRAWATVVPVAIARHFKVPQFRVSNEGAQVALTENERVRHRNSEIAKLLRASLRHAGVPEELAQNCSVEITNSPLVPHTVRAERYRPPSEKAFITHARVQFPCDIRGPLLLGDRRHSGLGLFAAVPS